MTFVDLNESDYLKGEGQAFIFFPQKNDHMTLNTAIGENKHIPSHLVQVNHLHKHSSPSKRHTLP